MLVTVLEVLGTLAGVLGAWLTWKTRREALRRELPSFEREMEVVLDAGQPVSAKSFRVWERYMDATARGGPRGWAAVFLIRKRRRDAPRTGLPTWASVLLGPDDAERYRKEWGAHLWELIAEGDLKQARRDRRRLIRVIFWLALVIRARRMFMRARAR